MLQQVTQHVSSAYASVHVCVYTYICIYIYVCVTYAFIDFSSGTYFYELVRALILTGLIKSHVQPLIWSRPHQSPAAILEVACSTALEAGLRPKVSTRYPEACSIAGAQFVIESYKAKVEGNQNGRRIEPAGIHLL